MSKFKIKLISSKDENVIKQVIALGDLNSATLGHFPKGAFIDKARKGHIIVAQINNKVVGYLLFNTVSSKHALHITHLCISESFRSKGIAAKLIDSLIDLYGTAFSFIKLNCRDDYVEAIKFWKSYGFKPVAVKSSRSKKEKKYLTTWVYDLNKLDLFSFSQTSGIAVLLDLNIIVDLRDQEDGQYEIQTLLADWLQNDVVYFFSSETYLEIQKDKDVDRRANTQKFLRKIQESKIVDKNEFKKVCHELLELLPKTSQNDLADKRQLATAIVNNIGYFITRDREMLEVSDKVYEKYGVQIFDPVQFICEIDQLLHATNYHPSRLAGANYTIQKCDAHDADILAKAFLKTDKGEKKPILQQKLSRLLSTPGISEIFVVKNESKKLIAISGRKVVDHSLIVNVIRANKSSLSITLFKQLITNLIRKARKLDLKQVEIREELLNDEEQQVLKEFSFQKIGDDWIKIIPQGVADSNSLSQHLTPFRHFDFVNQLITDFENNEKTRDSLLGIERLVYPLKIFNEQIPTFIIPIKPYWSSQLFDDVAAEQRIFSSDPEISWNRENVYYRSATYVDVLKNPARILWYLSDDKNSPRRRMIVGCCYIDHVEVGEAKKLYQTYKNYGIYNWDDIYKLAKEDIHKDIMAIRFSDNELFKTPIKLETAKNILLTKTGKKYSFQSPVKINENIFLEFYKLGFKL